MGVEWDSGKAVLNLRKHGIDFADAAIALSSNGMGTSPVRGKGMKKQYDFSRGKRGPVLRTPPGKTRITIRIDDDTLDWFRNQVHAAGGGSYQALMNSALRQFVESQHTPLEETIRRVLREELPKYAHPKSRGAVASQRTALATVRSRRTQRPG